MAQQTEPIKRLVAVKVIKPGMDSRQVLARFEAERQALALMDHPNIARVLDAQATPGGRPYFVMELVKGVPITRHCDEHRLTPKERLELFIPVCQAIQHAHQKGIIHRDIKPSNVLVALYDGKPVPKVIDFGVAKAAGQQLTEHTLVTTFGAVVGTLEYMSPEQAELNQLDIDTRSDVYSLGVLLYELLTGSTPLEKKRLKEAALLEVLRVIREEEPPRPSTRLSTTDELPSVAANRGLEPKKLSGMVRGELDWIVMKALDKDRNRRYETANGFAQDIQRYLADEPVQACPPSAWYRLRKFTRRNKGPVLAASIILLLLFSGIVSTSIGLVRAVKAEADATVQRQQTQQNLKLALKALDEIYVYGALKQWDKAIVDYAKLMKLKPDDARPHYNLGNVLRDQGDLRGASAAFQKAILLMPDFAEAHCNLGGVLQQQAELHKALEEIRRGHELGSKNPRWPYPSAQWVRQCERLVELDGKLPAFIEGKATPASAAERIELAALCSLKRLNRAAARFYEEAFAAQPKLANGLAAVHRYNSACAAALAGCGQGKDADRLNEKEKAHLRGQALGWLQAELALRTKQLTGGKPADGAVVQATMRHWQLDADFAGVRDPDALAKLPDAERQPWHMLWKEVGNTLHRAQGKAAPDKKVETK